MDKEVYVGKIVSTHGIKGELKILSNFQFKNKVFKVGNSLIINHWKYKIKSYRVHKNFDMVTLNDYTNINEVLFLLKKDVYFSYDNLDLSIDEVLDEELMSFKVLTNKGKVGIIKEIFFASGKNKILRVMFDKEVLIPFNSPMIVSLDKDSKELHVELLEGME